MKINPSDPKNNSGGEAASSWAYMDIMMDINDKKKAVFPAKLSNAGSLPGDDVSDDAVVPGGECNVNDEVNVGSGKKKAAKRSANQSVIQLMKAMYEERKTDSEKRHKENLTAFNRMLDIMDEKL